MANSSRRKIFGSNGYDELAITESLNKEISSSNYLSKKRKKKEREYEEYRKAQIKKRPSQRAMKTLHPKGTGKRNIGNFR